MIFMIDYDLSPLHSFATSLFHHIATIIYVSMKIYVSMCQNRTLIFYDWLWFVQSSRGTDVAVLRLYNHNITQ